MSLRQEEGRDWGLCISLTPTKFRIGSELWEDQAEVGVRLYFSSTVQNNRCLGKATKKDINWVSLSRAYLLLCSDVYQITV